MTDSLRNKPAILSFQGYTTIYALIEQEVEGLNDTQLDWTSTNYAWADWSIRNNVSHMASSLFRWFLIRWGHQRYAPSNVFSIPDMPTLYPDNIPYESELSFLAQVPTRRMDDSRYWDMAVILGKLSDAINVVRTLLDRETLGFMQKHHIIPEQVGQWKNLETMKPGTVYQDSSNPPRWCLTLEGTCWHLYYELVTHLYNVQRIKKAQGLPTRSDLPQEGYWTLPHWDRSEA